MAQSTYQPPVDKLLTYGDARTFTDLPNYLMLGLTTEHIHELIRMATDPELNSAMSDTLEVWAPIHALRALGQLHAEAAIEPLILLLDKVDDDDSLFEELPGVFTAIGPAAIPALSAYLDHLTHVTFARVIVAGDALTRIVQQHPETREVVVKQLTKDLTRTDRNDAAINGFLIADLIELEALESAAEIKAAYYADKVDTSIVGDWYGVRERLRLDPSIEVPGPDPLRRERRILPGLSFPGLRDSSVQHKSPKKVKNKRKQEKKSRKQNRKRK